MLKAIRWVVAMLVAAAIVLFFRPQAYRVSQAEFAELVEKMQLKRLR